VLKNDENLKKRWKEYFEKLLIEEYTRKAVEDVSELVEVRQSI